MTTTPTTPTTPTAQEVRSPQPPTATSVVVAEAVRRARARLAAQAKPGAGMSHTDFPGHHTCA